MSEEKTWCQNCANMRNIPKVDVYIFCAASTKSIHKNRWFEDGCLYFEKKIPEPEYNPDDVAFTEKDKEAFKQEENNAEYFQWFKDECIYWINKFELNDYAIYFRSKDLGNAGASCNVDVSMKDANLSLNSKLEFKEYEDPHYLVHKYAFHEVIELLMYESYYYMEVSEGTSYRIIHSIINKLNKVVFEPAYKERYKND